MAIHIVFDGLLSAVPDTLVCGVRIFPIRSRDLVSDKGVDGIGETRRFDSLIDDSGPSVEV